MTSMKKAIGIAIALVVVALAVVFLVIPKKHLIIGPGPQAQATLQNFVPQSTVAYYSVRDIQGTWKQIRGSQFYKDISALPFWKEIQAQDAIGNFLKAFKEGFGFELTEQRIMEVVGDEVAIAVLMGAPADPEPKVLILTRAGAKVQIAELGARLLDKAKASGKIESWSYNGMDLHNIKSADPTSPELNYCFMENILVFGIGKTRNALESVVDLYKGKTKDSISNSENFKKFVSLTSDVKGKSVGIFYMDFDQISKVVAEAKLPIPGAVGANLGQTLSLLKMIGGVSTINDGFFTKIYVVPNKQNMDPTTRALWDIKPQPLQSIGYVPEGTVLYSVTNSMDVKRLWNIWKDNLSKQAPDQAKPILDAIAQAETNLGINVEADLLSWIGDEIAYTFNEVSMETVLPIPKMALMVKVTDKAKAQAFIEKLVDYANRQAAKPAGAAGPGPAEADAALPPAEGAETPAAEPAVAPPVQPVAPRFVFEESSYNGVTMKFIAVPLMGKGLTPGFAFLGDFLVLSTSTAVLEKMVDLSQGKGNSLLKDPNFMSIRSQLPEKTNQMGYINTQRIFDVAIDVCKWIISFQQLNVPPTGGPESVGAAQTNATQKVLNETVIPILQALKVVRVVGINTTYTENGIEQIITTRVQDAAVK